MRENPDLEMPEQPLLRRQTTGTMNRRLHLAEMEANRTTANVDGMKKTLTKSFLAISYFLLCMYLPAIFGQTRNPQCHFNALKANDYFAFLLVGLIGASTLVDYINFKIVCSRMSGQPLLEYL